MMSRAWMAILLVAVLGAGCLTQQVPIEPSKAPTTKAPAATSMPAATGSKAPTPASSLPAASSAPPSGNQGSGNLPVIQTAYATEITSDAATVRWTVTGPGPLESWIVYGRTAANLSSLSQHRQGIGDKEVGLSELSGVYYYQVVARNAAGTVQSGTQGFSTSHATGQTRGSTEHGPPSSQNATAGPVANPCGGGVPAPDMWVQGITPTPFADEGLHFGLCPNMTVYLSADRNGQLDIDVKCGGTGTMTIHVDYGLANYHDGSQPSISDVRANAWTPSQPICAHFTLRPFADGTLVRFAITVSDGAGNFAATPELSGYIRSTFSLLIVCTKSSGAGACTGPFSPPSPPFNPATLSVPHGAPFTMAIINRDYLTHKVQIDSTTVLSPDIAPNGSYPTLQSPPRGLSPGTYHYSLVDNPSSFGVLTVT